MISPSIRMEDVDEGGFAVLEEHVSRRDLGGGPQLHVLHESGRVVTVVHTVDGPVPGPHADLGDPQAAAARLRGQSGVDRVVLLDADAYNPREEPAVVQIPQPTLFATLTQRFWSSPAVVTDPAPVVSRWPELALRLPREGHVLLVVDEAVRLQGRLSDGLLVSVTTLDLAAPPDDVVLDLRLTTAQLEELLTAPDVAAALLELEVFACPT